MDTITKHYLKSIAASLFQQTYADFCPPISIQRAQQILKVLADGQWHTATEILAAMNQRGGRNLKSAEYVRSILNACSTGWAIESHKRKGYRQPDDADGNCRVCGGTGYKDKPENDCSACNGQGSYWAMDAEAKSLGA